MELAVLVFCLAALSPLSLDAQNVTTLAPALPGFPNMNLAAVDEGKPRPLLLDANPQRPDGGADFGIGRTSTTPESTTSDLADCGNNNCTLNLSHVFEHRNNTRPTHRLHAKKTIPAQAIQVALDQAKNGGSAAAVLLALGGSSQSASVAGEGGTNPVVIVLQPNARK